MLPQFTNAQLAKLVVQIWLHWASGQRELRSTKHIFHYFWHQLLCDRGRRKVDLPLGRQINNIALKNRADFQPPLLTARQISALRDRRQPP